MIEFRRDSLEKKGEKRKKPRVEDVESIRGGGGRLN